MFAIRKISASDLGKLRDEAFMTYPGLQDAWTAELEQAEATQNFLNGTQNYPVLKGMQTNLYKCFLPLGWRLAATVGWQPICIRKARMMTPRAGHFVMRSIHGCGHIFSSSTNCVSLQNGTPHKYSINIYGAPQDQPAFDQLANLFVPATVDACYAHDGTGLVGGYKPKKVNGTLLAM